MNFVYQWHDELTHPQADNLDTRLRAYITCAIYDFAVAAGLGCLPGPLHGQRPSWQIAGHSGYTSLIGAGFDTDEKICWLQIGPGMMDLNESLSGNKVTQQLSLSFKQHFAQISV